MQPKEVEIKAKDGTYFQANFYHMEKEFARGTVVVCHGFGEHMGSYKELAEHLGQANYSCVVFDQRGHGGLPGRAPGKKTKKRGAIPGYQSFLDDVDAVIAAIKIRRPNTPLVLYGHSMGGNIAINYMLKCGQSAFSCAVLEAPWLGLHKNVGPPPAGLIAVLGGLLPNVPLPQGLTKLSPADITSDEEKQKEVIGDPLYHNRMTLRLLSAINSGCAYALNNASRLSIPIFLAGARGDTIVSNEAIREFAKAAGHTIVFREYDSHHAIHNDKAREKYYHDIVEFIHAHCPAG